MSGAASREQISIFFGLIDLIKACYDQAHLAEILSGGVGSVYHYSFWIQLRLLRFSHVFSFLHGLFLASEYPTEYEEWLFGSEASVS